MRYNPKAYANFERAKALYPVEIDNLPSDYDSRVDTRRLKYWRLTPAGRAHEVMRPFQQSRAQRRVARQCS
jgi:hypothetical protein